MEEASRNAENVTFPGLACDVAMDEYRPSSLAIDAAARLDNEPALADALRDLLGNPWRPVTLPPGPMRKLPCPGCGSDNLLPAATGSPPARASKCLKCLAEGPPWGEVITYPCPWLTPTVLSLAEAAYEKRSPGGTLDPARLAVLSDALEESGCVAACPFIGPNAHHSRQCSQCGGTRHVTHPLLAHLRESGPHYRGCHALDLILGRS
jgi:hypothetical protein